MQFHNLKSPKRKHKKRIGRGGKRGTYSGRGIKGQKARSGRRIRPQMRDTLKKIPKKRGYRFTAFRAKPFGINLEILERHYAAGETVSLATLLEKGLLKKQGGKMPAVKILGNGEITKKFTIEGCDMSAAAREKVEKAGGNIAGTRNL